MEYVCYVYTYGMSLVQNSPLFAPKMEGQYLLIRSSRDRAQRVLYAGKRYNREMLFLTFYYRLFNYTFSNLLFSNLIIQGVFE